MQNLKVNYSYLAHAFSVLGMPLKHTSHQTSEGIVASDVVNITTPTTIAGQLCHQSNRLMNINPLAGKGVAVKY